MKVCLTGSTGFVGSALGRRLREQGVEVVPVTRRPSGNAGLTYEQIATGPATSSPLTGCTAVLHLAARVHVMNDTAETPIAAYREANVARTISLARAAAAAGVGRFIFVSSIKVNGELTKQGQPFASSDPPTPGDPYAVSKWEAEQALHTISSETGMEIVIIRPPLVYGPGVKANFASLMSAVRRGLPLPLGAVTHNRRSLISLDNLVDLLIQCIDHPAAAGHTFLVSDGEDLSTTGLLLRLGKAMGKPPRLLPVPPALLRFGATVIGKKEMMERLLGNLQVDISHTRNILGWAPPVSVDEGLRRAAQGWRR